jgi:hypothetical protein
VASKEQAERARVKATGGELLAPADTRDEDEEVA